jgi:hypothetical protein
MRYTAMLLLLVSAARAGPPTVIKETAAQIERGVKEGNLIPFRSGVARARNLRSRYGDKEFEPIVKELGDAVKHENEEIALMAIEALGEFKNHGSGRYLADFLKAPKTVYLAQMPLYEAAIKAAGSIHDLESLSPIEKLLGHEQTRIGVAAAGALAYYRILDRKPRLVLIKRLANELERLEKAEAKAEEEKLKEHFGAVRVALRDTLRKMTFRRKLETAADVRRWLKEEADV